MVNEREEDSEDPQTDWNIMMRMGAFPGISYSCSRSVFVVLLSVECNLFCNGLGVFRVGKKKSLRTIVRIFWVEYTRDDEQPLDRGFYKSSKAADFKTQISLGC
jgi:hypothetical protein